MLNSTWVNVLLTSTEVLKKSEVLKSESSGVKSPELTVLTVLSELTSEKTYQPRPSVLL